jgi:PRTRC genetic system protein B
MQKITNQFNQAYIPEKALIFRRHLNNTDGYHDNYVELMDIDKATGLLINAHPLTKLEAISLARTLDTTKAKATQFLRPSGLLSPRVLYLDPDPDFGYVVWYTPASEQPLFFIDDLGIPSGKKAWVPPLLWKASKTNVAIYAFAKKGKPNLKTPLFRAPFFNTGSDGLVCMGSVEIKTDKCQDLENFIKFWQTYFFHSYFTHLSGSNPIKGNLVSLWMRLIQTGDKFPLDVMLPTQVKLGQLINHRKGIRSLLPD